MLNKIRRAEFACSRQCNRGGGDLYWMCSLAAANGQRPPAAFEVDRLTTALKLRKNDLKNGKKPAKKVKKVTLLMHFPFSEYKL